MSKISLPLESWLKPLSQSLSELFSSTNEPQISQQLDPSGRARWHIYHPHTQKIVEFSSETEMLEWLDRHPMD